MSRARRRSFLALAAVTAVLAAVQLATGVDELTLYAAPLLLLCALLLSGTFVGEEWIAARRRTASPVRRRAVARRWTRERERALTSLLERAVRTLRGPPAAIAAARPQ